MGRIEPVHIAVHDYGHWRSAARSLLTRETPPTAVIWADASSPERRRRPFVPPAPPHAGHVVPRRFLRLTANGSTAADPDRWALFYRLAWRLTHGEPDLLDDHADPEVARLEELAARLELHRPPDHRSAARFVPPAADPTTLELAMDRCTACHRCHQGPAVAGGGPIGAPLLLVAESPDEAAVAARWPLVGDAGEALGRALATAGVPIEWVRTTYALKHKSRPGETASERRTLAGRCRPWLMAEMAVDPPEMIVALGDVAARAAIGRGGRWTDPEVPIEGPGGVPVFVAPDLRRLRLAEIAGDGGPTAELVAALVAAARVHDPGFEPPLAALSG